MNWNGHKILLIGFIISSVLLMICLSGCQTDTGGQSPSKIHDLIVDFNESAIVGAEEFIPFHDPLLRKQKSILRKFSNTPNPGNAIPNPSRDWMRRQMKFLNY